jgi:hypothetical protein
LNSPEKVVFKEKVCACIDGVTTKVRGSRRMGKEKAKWTHHGLDALEIEIIIRVTVIDDGAHARIDDRLEFRECRASRVTSRGKLAIHVVIFRHPFTL